MANVGEQRSCHSWIAAFRDASGRQHRRTTRETEPISTFQVAEDFFRASISLVNWSTSKSSALVVSSIDRCSGYLMGSFSEMIVMPVMIVARPTSWATISGLGNIFSAAMIIATPTITNGFIIPRVRRIIIGGVQQTQQAAPCLQPRKKLVSRTGQEVSHPSGERQRSSPVIFQRVNWNAPAAISATPESTGIARLKDSQRVTVAANGIPSA